MNRENKDLSENSPEISAIEAALAELRPRREAGFVDEAKSQVKNELSGATRGGERATETVRIPLTHYIRIAQFNAAASGLFAGLFLCVLLGGWGVFFVLDRFYITPSQPVESGRATPSRSVQMLLVNEASLTPVERALFDELEKEISHGR
ncbi:MAG: hypothetical protein ABGX22_04290 [Pirellulaceae bacterium]